MQDKTTHIAVIDTNLLRAQADANHAEAELIKARAEHVDTELMLQSEENKTNIALIALQSRIYTGLFIVGMSSIVLVALIVLLPLFV